MKFYLIVIIMACIILSGFYVNFNFNKIPACKMLAIDILEYRGDLDSYIVQMDKNQKSCIARQLKK